MANLQFPKDLDLDTQPFMLLTAFSWNMRGKKTQDLKTTVNVEDSLILPMPSNGIIDSTQHNWDEAAGLGASNLTKTFVRNAVTKTADVFGELGKYITAKEGYAINDYASLAFSGTTFRTFDFTFNLMPKNESEAETLRNVVKSLKRNSLPEYADWKISYPHFWNIDVKFPNNKDIIKIKNCVMMTLTVSHFPDNTITIYKDGSPIRAEISTTFRELERINRSEYED